MCSVVIPVNLWPSVLFLMVLKRLSDTLNSKHLFQKTLLWRSHYIIKNTVVGMKFGQQHFEIFENYTEYLSRLKESFTKHIIPRINCQARFFLFSHDRHEKFPDCSWSVLIHFDNGVSLLYPRVSVSSIGAYILFTITKLEFIFRNVYSLMSLTSLLYRYVFTSIFIIVIS